MRLVIISFMLYIMLNYVLQSVYSHPLSGSKLLIVSRRQTLTTQ